jgi:rhodanese-related sulfurtransferase
LYACRFGLGPLVSPPDLRGVALPSRLPELPRGPVWVHGQGGYRASIAASLLQAAGLAVTAVDGDFSRAADAGLALAGPVGRTSAAAG